MSSFNSISIRKICSNFKNDEDLLISNPNQSTGRVIIAKSQPPHENCHANQNLGAPIQLQFNSSDGTLYSGNNSFFQSQSNNDIYFPYNVVPSYESSCQSLTHTTRASPATVEWLVENFEPAEGCSLRRSTLYSFYIQHCSQDKLEPVNPASFGKLIRSVFLGLKTRRLGTRGNSKYHYYGIRLKQNSSLNICQDQQRSLVYKQSNSLEHFQNERWINSNDQQQYSPENKPDFDHFSPTQPDTKQFLINQFILIDSSIQLPNQITLQSIKRFQNSYKDHSNKLFDVITRLDFGSVEQIWLNYWSDNEFQTISSLSCVETFIMNCDYQLYEEIVQRLIGDILSPMTVNSTQSIRTFGKSVDGWIRKALNDYPSRFKTIKLTIVNAFAMTLRRYTSLNHLAQSARSVLLNSTQVNQMLSDLNKVDFQNVQEQCWWICQCDENVVRKIFKEFKDHLSSESPLEEWSQWLNSLLNHLLKPYSNCTSESFTKQAKQILLNWSFYCSMVIRDLTLRSASSFGSFHLIRLLFDEYLFYLCEHQIASHTQKTSIGVIAQSTLDNKFSSNERRNISSKISFVLTKDSLSQTKLMTLPDGTIQLPIFNKFISTSRDFDSVKRFKTTDEIDAIQ